jgi:hypothetical protein
MIPISIPQAFDDPDAIVSLVRGRGPYPSIASYLPPAATRAGAGGGPTDTTAAWFRGNWAVAGRVLVAGAGAILANARFATAAAELFDTDDVIPTTVVVNVNAPMPAGAVHLDIPSFRGANRDRYPLRLLQAMGTSGLFEPWRIVEAGAVTWFYDGPGGAYDYWPDGLDGPMHSVGPPYTNTSLVADNDRMYHRIGAVGDTHRQQRLYPASASIVHRDNAAWEIINDGHPLDAYTDTEVRISILWKAQVALPSTGEQPEPLTLGQVTTILTHDLGTRDVDAPTPTSPLDNETWIDLVHHTYYPSITIE